MFRIIARAIGEGAAPLAGSLAGNRLLSTAVGPRFGLAGAEGLKRVLSGDLDP